MIISSRNLLFNINILKSREYNIPIICVGNISAGGTGKTPHVEYILKLLMNKKTALISRGYGRRTKGLVYVESDSSFLDVGDEPLQIKNKFPRCKVISCGNRRKGIQYILKKFPETEVILMDDGFQHRWVRAGLNILLNNYNKPLYSDKIIPLGNLREQISSIKRANIIITSKCPKKITSDEKEKILKKLQTYSSQTLFFSFIENKSIRSSTTNKKKDIPKDINITLITSIAETKELIDSLEKKGHSVYHIKFPDHHNYTEKDIDYILNEFDRYKSTKNIILTTEKDEVKFKHFKKRLSKVNFYTMPIEIIVDNKAKFDKQIITYVENHRRNN